MKKAILIIAFIFVSIAGIFLLTQFGQSGINTVEDIEQISYTQSLSQAEDDYIVYFWQEGCYYCELIAQDVVDFAKDPDHTLYVVDMQQEENHAAWYDWVTHQDTYNEKIGEVIDGEEQINADIQLEDYTEDPDVNWDIVTTDDNEIVAVHQTPYPNTTIESADQIEITGTPTMIHVQNGAVEQYVIGSEPSLELLTK